MSRHLTGKNDLSFQLERQMMNSFRKDQAGSGPLRNPELRETRTPSTPSVEQNGTHSAGSPTSQDLLQRVEKLESLLNFYSDLHRQAGSAGKIDVRDQIRGKGFFENYYFRNQPVILTSLMGDWPAMKKWCPDYFSRHYGHIPVEITKGREKDQDYEKDFRKTVATIPFEEFIDQIKQQSSSNDIYLVARNYFFSNPQLQTLRDDIIPPGEIIDNSFEGLQNMKFWFGPRGTVTPLHHDKHSILFCQVSGRKHFKMIPSFDLPKIYNTDRYYSEVDPEHLDPEKFPLFRNASVADIIVDPGDILFIPAGWWHWVRSLDISISVTFSNFQVPGYNTTWNCR